MLRTRTVELIVGLFMAAGVLALLTLVFKVSGITTHWAQKTYTVSAEFDNIGDLKLRAPVSLAGVKVGEVTMITLVPITLRALVRMTIVADQNKIPANSTARILTQGLLGANYIGITPGYIEENAKEIYLHQGSKIEDTESAIIIENLVGQLLFNINNKQKNSKEPS